MQDNFTAVQVVHFALQLAGFSALILVYFSATNRVFPCESSTIYLENKLHFQLDIYMLCSILILHLLLDLAGTNDPLVLTEVSGELCFTCTHCCCYMQPGVLRWWPAVCCLQENSGGNPDTSKQVAAKNHSTLLVHFNTCLSSIELCFQYCISTNDIFSSIPSNSLFSFMAKIG